MRAFNCKKKPKHFVKYSIFGSNLRTKQIKREVNFFNNDFLNMMYNKLVENETYSESLNDIFWIGTIRFREAFLDACENFNTMVWYEKRMDMAWWEMDDFDFFLAKRIISCQNKKKRS